MKKQFSIVLGLAALAGVVYMRGCKTTVSTGHQPAPVLSKDESARIIIEPRKHRVTVITPRKTIVAPISDDKNEIDIKKDGSVTVKNNPLGGELRPFIGVGVLDKPTVVYGVDWFHLYRLNLGTGLSFSLKNPRLFMQLDYNLYSNLCIGLLLDNHKTIGGDVLIRF